MSLINDFKIATSAINSNRSRTALTVTGLVIGVASIFMVFSAGEGLESLITGQIESFGTDFIQTEIKVPTGKTPGSAADESASGQAIVQGVQVTSLTLDDMEDINKLDNIVDSYGALMSQGITTYKSEKESATIFGVSSSYIDIDASKVEYGRFYTKMEDKSLSQVVVLGSELKEKLFGESDAVGKTIKIKSRNFTVVGVMEERGAVMTLDFDNFIYIPVRTLQKKMMGIDHVMYMTSKVRDIDLSYDTAEEMRYVLRTNHDIIDETKDDFRVTTMDEMMEMLGTITGAITLLLLAIVIISLIVAGVGITNVMYVIISERTTEIGLRKAVGANYYHIIRQFLIESILITLLGFLFGFIIGAILSFAIAMGAQYAGLDWKFSIPLKSIITSFFFSLFAGVIFGYFPARKAALMEPVTALRKE
ncbi:MAG: ABC transporter permease [Patescibacteria group bacterium]|jgi:putative ABC transport system permease protein|nr:ABC transporter permease [Patescibacteria group bacterium]